ncbi:hypothetical protein [Mesobacillus maritimus]|uniref:hypothetical protein n=1 Tax=Mesobacillus maritimus TaxID=1643336 RepID=UPI001C8DC91A|nr:hypothetical protein [Mesobacillus maritimus]
MSPMNKIIPIKMAFFIPNANRCLNHPIRSCMILPTFDTATGGGFYQGEQQYSMKKFDLFSLLIT